MSAHQFLLMWDCNGLELVVDVTADEQRRMWENLQGQLPSESAVPSLNHLLLRAKYNSQRNYEIYTVTAAEGITEQDLREMFANNPQSAAELIRARGACVFSDILNTKDRVII